MFMVSSKKNVGTLDISVVYVVLVESVEALKHLHEVGPHQLLVEVVIRALPTYVFDFLL